MELDALKTIWKDVNSPDAGTTTTQQLEEMLRRQSKSPIAKMKRNLLVELVFVVVIYAVTILYYFLNFKGGMLSFAWILIMLGAAYIFYYIRKRKLLNSMECVTCEVKSNLTTQLVTLEKYIKLYMWAGTLLFPLVMLITFLISYFYSPEMLNEPDRGKPFFILVYITVALVFSLVLTIPVYFLNKWYVHKLYGQHAKKLRVTLNEMNEMPFGG